MYKIRLNTRQRAAPPEVAARVSLQNASTVGWDRYVGRRGTNIGMRAVGLSAPVKVVEAHFGFYAGCFVAAVNEQLARHAPTA
jgi:transketolase